MTSDTLIIALLTATALLLAIGWFAIIIGAILTMRRVHGVLRAIELTAESVRNSATSRRPLWQAARTLWEFQNKRTRKE